VTIRVAVIDDHPLVLEAVSRRLEAQRDIEVVGTAAHGDDLQRLVRETSPDVVVLDLSMATGYFEPLTAIESLRQTHPKVRILVLTGLDDELLMRSLVDAGVQGYVLKSDNLSLCLPEGVRALYEGRRFYSPAVTDKFFASRRTALLDPDDLAMLNLLAQGHSNARIGKEMRLSAKTVANRLWHIYKRLGVEHDADTNRRVGAINKARELGLLPETEIPGDRGHEEGEAAGSPLEESIEALAQEMTDVCLELIQNRVSQPDCDPAAREGYERVYATVVRALRSGRRPPGTSWTQVEAPERDEEGECLAGDETSPPGGEDSLSEEPQLL
jgi:DNA-binding NarL/FixJ family response regulator